VFIRGGSFLVLLNFKFHDLAKVTPGCLNIPETFWSMKGITANVQYRSKYVGVTFNGTISVSKQKGFINLSLCCAGTAFGLLVNNAIHSTDKAIFSSLASKAPLAVHVHKLICSQIHLTAAARKL